MKPRTKLQFRVVGLSSQLPDIESMMTEWANNDCLNHIGYATKSRVVCMECGERFSTELVNRKRAVCPHCGASLKIEWSRKRTNQQFIRIGKADICEEFLLLKIAITIKAKATFNNCFFPTITTLLRFNPSSVKIL